MIKTIKDFFVLNRSVKKNTRNKYPYLIFLTIICSFFEVVTIGSIVPVITLLIFPENLLEIHDKCFMNTAVVNLKLPDSLTFLGNHVFSNCIELKTVKLGETLNVIEMSCFANCTNLKIVYSESCKKLDYIGYGAFTNCKSLEKIYFPYFE